MSHETMLMVGCGLGGALLSLLAELVVMNRKPKRDAKGRFAK